MPTFANAITGPENDNAIEGSSINGRGVIGTSESNYGMRAHSTKSAGIRGSSVEGRGVEGWATKSEGVVGISTDGTGIWGQTDGGGIGVLGTSKGGIGVLGEAQNAGDGVVGTSKNGAGVRARSDSGHGAEASSARGDGVRGTSTEAVGVHGVAEHGGAGVVGESRDGVGVRGTSQTGEGLHGETSGSNASAVVAIHRDPAGAGAALRAEKGGDRGHAGFFQGNVHVTRDLSVEGEIWANAGDCAEDFDIADVASCEPGTVMVVGAEGALHPSQSAYDRKVVGVVSGAGSFRPAIVLDKQQAVADRRPIALMGKVFCKVDARSTPIQMGDLLTSSDLPGHAMKAADTSRAFGAVIGKALQSLEHGRGLLPILVTLQ